MTAFRAYLDSSGKLDRNYLTLVAVAAPEYIWSEFELAWANMVERHSPEAQYLHMRELAFQVDGGITCRMSHD
ncbi:MAG TPA: hypothetical protein VFA90_02955 [Terriglobales bacterium]|nr:hypothetical protein [Terriglobales bacterium]